MSSAKQQFDLQWAWIDGEARADVWVDVDADGVISRVSAKSEDVPADNSKRQRIRGLVLPGFPNVHSHAFQRGMAGLTEYRTSDQDDFWSWRRLMFHFLRHLTPDDCFVIARQLYIEMLKHGYTTVGEFHYLHNDFDGQPYSDGNVMAEALLAAAADAGIRVCLIPTLYQQGGFGGEPLEGGQRRFYLSNDQWLDQLRILRRKVEKLDYANLGAAIHSLRAVDLESIRAVVPCIDELDPKMPRHIHLGEQVAEVAACKKHLNRTPVAVALDEFASDDRWCFIHATHSSDDELQRMATARVIAGLCPTTEANLGDGVFPIDALLNHGGSFAIGSDSHIAVDLRGELRAMEYAQRLVQRRRVVVAGDDDSCGHRLCRHAWQGGAAALKLPLGTIAAGHYADWIVLDIDHPTLSGLPPARWLDAFVFSQIGDPLSGTLVGGRWVVSERSHSQESLSALTFRETIERVVAAL